MSEEVKTAKKILIIDDDQEITESVRLTLESRGYEVFNAVDGNQGLVMTEQKSPDLIILDMMMPKRSGFLVLEKLRRSLPVPIRVIMITANEGNRHKSYAETLGVDPSECLVFEDVLRGVIAGRCAGMRVCACYDPVAEYEDTEKKKIANCFIKSFNELLI